MPIAATDKRGLKRICMSCSTRFYDFNKRPIICPNCETEFTGDMKIKIRRSRVANDDEGAISKVVADEVEIETIKDMADDEEEEVVADTVSLDEVEDDDADEDEEVLDADLELDEEDDVDDDDDDDLEDDDDEEDEE